MKGEERSPQRVPISSISKEKHPLSVYTERRRTSKKTVSQPRRDREQKENWKHPELRRETHNKSKSKISKEETTVSNNVVKEEREKKEWSFLFLSQY